MNFTVTEARIFLWFSRGWIKVACFIDLATQQGAPFKLPFTRNALRFVGRIDRGRAAAFGLLQARMVTARLQAGWIAVGRAGRALFAPLDLFSAELFAPFALQPALLGMR